MKKSSLLLVGLLWTASLVQAEIVALETFDYADGDTWEGLDEGEAWDGPWSGENVLGVEGKRGGYFGDYGKEGNTESKRKLGTTIPMSGGELWGKMTMKVEHANPEATSVSQFRIGQGALGSYVSIIGMASGSQDQVDNPIADSIWAVRSQGAGGNSLVIANEDATQNTTIIWHLVVSPDGNDSFQVWLNPKDSSSEKALGDPTLKVDDFDWIHPVQMIAFANNGQARFEVDDLTIATSLGDLK